MEYQNITTFRPSLPSHLGSSNILIVTAQRVNRVLEYGLPRVPTLEAGPPVGDPFELGIPELGSAAAVCLGSTSPKSLQCVVGVDLRCKLQSCNR